MTKNGKKCVKSSTIQLISAILSSLLFNIFFICFIQFIIRFMAQNISVPDIGDFKDVEVIEILVKPGDQINKNDPIVTIESDKSSVEIPSPSAGQIKDLKVKIGDKVSEGSLLATIENGQAASSPKQEIKREVVKEELIQEKPKTNGNLNPVKQVKKVFAEPASKDDIDPIETNEWIESLNSVIESDGAPRASYLLNKVIDLSLIHISEPTRP